MSEPRTIMSADRDGTATYIRHIGPTGDGRYTEEEWDITRPVRFNGTHTDLVTAVVMEAMAGIDRDMRECGALPDEGRYSHHHIDHAETYIRRTASGDWLLTTKGWLYRHRVELAMLEMHCEDTVAHPAHGWTSGETPGTVWCSGHGTERGTWRR